MQHDPVVDMERTSKSNPGPKSSTSTTKSLGSNSQQERQKDPQQFGRNPRKNKPNPQKYQSCHDKRPQTRGYTCNTETYRGKTAYEASSGYSAFCDEKKQKKVNLNHLLNFTYQAAAQTSSTSISHGRRHQHKTYLPRYNKELYLQATCQFIVKQTGDYTIHSVDPDHPVEWDLIEQVRLNSPQVPSCPICLYPPTAGKIAKCGHVFCYSCILHYLALSDKPWRKCPICYDPVDRNTLRSLTAVGLKEYNVGDEICLRLLRREKNSVNIHPVENYGGETDAPWTIETDAPRQMYAKVLTASPEQVLEGIVLPEQDELMKQMEDNKDEPEKCFIEEALQLVEKRIEGLIAEKNIFLPLLKENTRKSSSEQAEVWESIVVSPEVETVVYSSAFDETLEEDGANRQRNISESSAGLDSNPDSTVTVDDIEAPTPRKDDKICAQSGARSKIPKTTHYFYQCADGQNVYMHSVNIQMLIEEYGSLENCPPVIKVKIVELEPATMHSDLRAKLRYLQHLPISAQFQIAEVKLGRLVSRETFDLFREKLYEREKRRAKRARSERLREQRIRNQEAQSYERSTGFTYSMHESFSEPLLPPTNFDEDFAPLPSAESPEKFMGRQAEAAAPDGLSFAAMLKEGKKQPTTNVPTLETPKPSGILTLRRRPVTGSDEDDVDMPAPLYRESLGDAIAIAMERANFLKKPVDEKADGRKAAEEGKSKKKKNNKGVMLFQTSMARGSGK
ncbi:unnamed protein product [Notodromas monacha]|uniref:E3 ubiquitin-protein ligase RNF10 n=1 Tax=Notodromas monacha TaxID=399045 RepID=A0A7R9GHA3_9CRUS|nr:unnamed protein product [Notodromas monacha]CAG0921104.1 unnamed protein product [Notodromas monacha]